MNNNHNKGYSQNSQNNQINNMNNNMNVNSVPLPRETEEYMYPEVYQKFMPVVEQIIKEMEKQYGNIYLNEDLLNKMIDEAIKRAGIGANVPSQPQPQFPSPYAVKDSVSDDMKDGDTIPTFNEFGGHGRRGGGHWRGYDRGALSDIYRILFLQSIFGRRRPFWRWR